MSLFLRSAFVVTVLMLFTAACNSRGGRGHADSGMSGNDAGPGGDSGSACSCDTDASCQASCSCDADCAAVMCTDTCSTSGDSECDDGGPDSVYSLCELGTDCTDCGPRTSDSGDAD